MSILLIEKLDQLKDKRRPEGKRHKLSTVVMISIMAMISQIYSLRGIAAFTKRHHKELVKFLNIEKDRLPSFYVIRTVLQQIDFDELSTLFKEWIIEKKLLNAKEWISIDGKCIRSTVKDSNSEHQNFVSVVTAFTHNSGIALLSAKFESKKTSEIEVAESLIRAIDLEDQVYTLDALHCKKNS